MDRLVALQTFVRVLELGSLSAAARDLRLSQSAVSQQMAALEKHLGARLLHRTTRRVTATAAGEDYYGQAKNILALVDASEAALRTNVDAGLKGSLRVQAPTGLGRHVVAGVAIDFQLRHPGVRVEVLLDDRIADLVGEGVDVAIRLGPLAPSMLVAKRLGTLDRILVASPVYARKHGLPETPESLATHPHVRFSWLANGDDITLQGKNGPVTVRVPTCFAANNTFVLIQAIEAGVGIGGVQSPLVREALARGSLVPVLPSFRYPPLEVHAVYPSAAYIPEIARTFVALLEDAMRIALER
jgi:DNA-binding transcriptional LysR family regulator